MSSSIVKLIFGAGMPSASVSSGSMVTVFDSCGRSSIPTPQSKAWPSVSSVRSWTAGAPALVEGQLVVAEEAEERPAERHHVPLRAEREAVRLVVVGELEREELRAPRAEPALEVVLVDPEHAHVRVEHEPLADEPRGVGEAVRAAGEEEQAGGADAVPGHDDDVGLLTLLVPVTVDVDRAGREAVPVRRDLADACAGDELRSVRESRGPHRRVGGALGARRAAPHAGARALAAGQAADVLGADRVGGRPPVPVELVHPLGRAAPDRADGEGRQERRRAGRVVRDRRPCPEICISWSIRS